MIITNLRYLQFGTAESTPGDSSIKVLRCNQAKTSQEINQDFHCGLPVSVEYTSPKSGPFVFLWCFHSELVWRPQESANPPLRVPKNEKLLFLTRLLTHLSVPPLSFDLLSCLPPHSIRSALAASQSAAPGFQTAPALDGSLPTADSSIMRA